MTTRLNFFMPGGGGSLDIIVKSVTSILLLVLRLMIMQEIRLTLSPTVSSRDYTTFLKKSATSR